MEGKRIKILIKIVHLVLLILSASFVKTKYKYRELAKAIFLSHPSSRVRILIGSSYVERMRDHTLDAYISHLMRQIRVRVRFDS